MTQEELTNYGISQSDIDDNKLNADASHITLDLAKQLDPYVGTPAELGFLAANVTDKYPFGVPSTETSKKMAWKVALEFFSLLLHEDLVLEELCQFLTNKFLVRSSDFEVDFVFQHNMLYYY